MTVFYDLETGGLDPELHPIIQIAAVAVNKDWQTTETFERKIKFDLDIASPKALEVNSYDEESWRKACEPEKAKVEFSGFLRRNASLSMKSRAGKKYKVAELAGHNVTRFDQPFLEKWFSGDFLPASYQQLDTLILAAWWRRAKGLSTDLKLSTLGQHFGLDVSKAHDALEDVVLNIEVARKIITDLKQS